MITQQFNALGGFDIYFARYIPHDIGPQGTEPAAGQDRLYAGIF
jgi:hypothetical protein